MVDDAVEVSAHAVELVDEDDTGNARFVGVTPVGLGLGLNAARSTEDTDTAVEDFEGTVNFDGEVNVSGSVDDVEAVVAKLLIGTGPKTGRGG